MQPYPPYELYKGIMSQGGLIPWSNYGIRLGFFLELTDPLDKIDEIIKHFSDIEDYENAHILNLEKHKLLDYIKNENK